MLFTDPPRSPRGELSQTERAFREQWRWSAGTLELLEIEHQASAAHRATGLRCPGAKPLWIARACDVRFRHGSPRGTGGAALVNGVIVFRAWIHSQIQGTAILHELAHALLARINPHHTERDAWLLTLCLAFPMEHLAAVRHLGWTVETLTKHQPHVEPWLLRCRVWMSNKINDLEHTYEF